jgi:hypothetical protein
MKIRCPKCSWEPDGKPYWQCTCGKNWDTFSTGGRCPSCHKIWEETQCPTLPKGCGKMSLHLDWYEDLGDILKEYKEELRERI